MTEVTQANFCHLCHRFPGTPKSRLGLGGFADGNEVGGLASLS